jgi:hypothetical protein
MRMKKFNNINVFFYGGREKEVIGLEGLKK